VAEYAIQKSYFGESSLLVGSELAH